MCVEAEYRGHGTGHKLGIKDSQATTHSADKSFEVIEIGFGALFTIELVAKLAALKFRFFKSGWNNFDSSVVGFELRPHR